LSVGVSDTTGLFTDTAGAIRVDYFGQTAFYLDVNRAVFAVNTKPDIGTERVFGDNGILSENHYTVGAARFQQPCHRDGAAYRYQYYYRVNNSQRPHQ
jgi:hypothetical protein